MSTYDKLNLQSTDFENLYKILSQSLDILGEVKKIRQLYLLDQTRIHIDYVEKLGHFLELEVWIVKFISKIEFLM